MTENHLPFRLTLAGLLFVLGACIVDVQDADESLDGGVSIAQESLFIRRASSLRASGAVRTCFQPFDRASYEDASWSTFTARVRQLIEDEYDALDGVNLDITGWALCTRWGDYRVGNQPADTVQIVLKMTGRGAGFRSCDDRPLDDNALSLCSGNRPVISLGWNYWALDSAIVHEFGHALGFVHEWDRADSPDRHPSGAPVCDQSTSFVRVDPATGVRWCDADMGSGGLVSGVFLTKYDPDSIMNSTYCHCRWELTELDRLGVEIAYPDGHTLRLIADGAFSASNGTVFTRDDTTITDEWSYRGAHAGAFGNNRVSEMGNYGSLGSARYINTRLIRARELIPVETRFEDFRGVSRVARSNVLVDNARHTAILNSVL